jgi:hypothetical protein
MGERQSWSEASHEQLVGAFRGLIQQERQKIQASEFEGFSYPAGIVRYELYKQELDRFSDDPLHKQRGEFFRQIRNAWDAIAYEHYRQEEYGLVDLYNEGAARGALVETYTRAKARNEPRPEIIKLDPLQMKILDALAEAADIPHQRGQAEISMPEKFRYYDTEIAQLEKRQQK